MIGDRQKPFVRVLGRCVHDFLSQVFGLSGHQPVVAFPLLEVGGTAKLQRGVDDVAERVQPSPVELDVGLLGRLVHLQAEIFHRCGRGGRVLRHGLAD